MANAKQKQQTAKKTQSKKAPAKKTETRAKKPQPQKAQNKNNSERKGLTAHPYYINKWNLPVREAVWMVYIHKSHEVPSLRYRLRICQIHNIQSR